MGRFEKRPENPRAKGDPYGAAETTLRSVTEELQIIHRHLLKSLQEDVKRLQAEKNRLANEIQRLQEEKEQLQPGRQINEQQALVRQLAQVLANHISSELQSSLNTLATQAVERVSQAGTSFIPSDTQSNAAEINENAEKLLGSLDDTLTITFNSLQQELKNYQSNISQQLSRMHNQQHQGEAILAELVNRLHRELEKTAEDPAAAIKEIPYPELENKHEAVTKLQLDSSLGRVAPPLGTPLQPTATETLEHRNGSTIETEISPPPAPVESVPSPEPTPQQVTPKQPLLMPMGLSSPMGLLLIVLSTVVSSLYNVAIKVIFQPGNLIFGVFEVERLIAPTLGNALLILMLRMLVVVPLMLVLAPILHPQIWQDLQNLVDSVRKPTPTNATAKRVLVLSLVSGCFLFLSQVLIYLAIGQVPTGIAIALFFVYPIITGLLSWLLFRDRPTLFTNSAIACIGLGELLVLGSSTSTGMDNISLGSITAIASGIAFALYVILTRICAAKLHPVTFTLINFATMLLLSLLGLLLLPTNWSLLVNSATVLELVLSAFILGVLTLCGYLLNNFGIRQLGATRSAIIGATVPALTVIFAGVIIQETLQLVQVLGVLLITFGAGTFSFEKMRNRVTSLRSEFKIQNSRIQN